MVVHWININRAVSGKKTKMQTLRSNVNITVRKTVSQNCQKKLSHFNAIKPEPVMSLFHYRTSKKQPVTQTHTVGFYFTASLMTIENVENIVFPIRPVCSLSHQLITNRAGMEVDGSTV